MVQIASLIALWVLAAGFFLIGITVVSDLYLSWNDKRDIQIRDAVSRLVAKNIGEQLQHTCYWFSESPQAMFALEEVGKALVEAESQYFNVSRARDEWRPRALTNPVGKVA